MKKGDYIRIKHDYMYMVYLLTKKINESKFEVVKIWQSSDGFNVSVSKETVDFKDHKIETYYNMSDQEINRFLNWIFEYIFFDPESIFIK